MKIISLFFIIATSIFVISDVVYGKEASGILSERIVHPQNGMSLNNSDNDATPQGKGP